MANARFQGTGVKEKNILTIPKCDLEDLGDVGAIRKHTKYHENLKAPLQESGVDHIYNDGDESDFDKEPLLDITDEDVVFDEFISETGGKIPATSISATRAVTRNRHVEIDINVHKHTPELQEFKKNLKSSTRSRCQFKCVSEKEAPAYQDENKQPKIEDSNYLQGSHCPQLLVQHQNSCIKSTYGGLFKVETKYGLEFYTTIANHALYDSTIHTNDANFDKAIISTFGRVNDSAQTSMITIGIAGHILNPTEASHSSLYSWSDIDLLQLSPDKIRRLPQLKHNDHPIKINSMLTNFDEIAKLQDKNVYFNGAASGSVTARVLYAHRNSSSITKNNQHARGVIYLESIECLVTRPAVNGDSGAWVWYTDPQTRQNVVIGTLFGGGYYNNTPVVYCCTFAYARNLFLKKHKLDLAKMKTVDEEENEEISSGYSSDNPDDMEAANARQKEKVRHRPRKTERDINNVFETISKNRPRRETAEIPHISCEASMLSLQNSAMVDANTASSGYETASDTSTPSTFINDIDEDLSVIRTYTYD